METSIDKLNVLLTNKKKSTASKAMKLEYSVNTTRSY